MSIRQATRRKILELGEDLMQKRGFNAFSYHHISSELGIKNAAIHYHFPSKESLGRQIIKNTHERFSKWISHPEHRVLPVAEQLDWLIKIYQYNLEKENRVCLIGSLATDYYTLPLSMQAGIRKLSADVQNWLAQLLEGGRQQGVLSFEGKSRDKALTILTSLAGSLQLARLLGNEMFHKVVEQIHLDLKLTY
ncbi:MAG: TetR/AcrR family transcriptional regulator [Cyclobacteriaceae bacterium]|nr:TetR/AcrR family transcriptional regulator [Cyclobacteriaceae bacterium]